MPFAIDAVFHSRRTNNPAAGLQVVAFALTAALVLCRRIDGGDDVRERLALLVDDELWALARRELGRHFTG